MVYFQFFFIFFVNFVNYVLSLGYIVKNCLLSSISIYAWLSSDNISGNSRKIYATFYLFRNNSARELSAFAESAMAVNRVVLQHMSINLNEEPQIEIIDTEANKENQQEIPVENNGKMAEKRKAPPFGLSPPSESKLIQRRMQSQSLNFHSCKSSQLTKNSSNYLVPTSSIVESPGC